MNEGGAPLDRLRKQARSAWQFALFVRRRFLDDRCLMTATALSYTTLLSIVPLLVVLFSTLSAFPAFSHVVERMQAYIFRNFVPAAGEIIQAYFSQFLERAGTLTGVGGAFLIVSALLLMNTIDTTINFIWRMRRRRRLVLKMAVYWAALTLGPVLLAVSIAGTSYLMTVPEADDIVRPVVRVLLSVLPFLFTALALTLLYVFVPNCSVPLRNGVIGAVVAAAAFEVAKAAFAGYVARGTAYATIYGALAAIPLFLTWIYVSWAIVLAGAELSFCLGAFKADRSGAAADPGFAPLRAAFRIVGHLWRAQLRGGTVSSAALLRREASLTVQELSSLMDRLQAHQIVYSVDAEEWALARDTGAFTLLELYRIFPIPLDRHTAGDWGSDDWSRALAARMHQVRAKVDEGLKALEVPLKGLYEGEGGDVSSKERRSLGSAS